MLGGMEDYLACANLSSVVYEDDVVIAGAGVIPFSVGNNHAIIVSDKDTAILAFRGTDDMNDAGADIRFIKVKWGPGGRVHRGFKSAFDDIWPELRVSLYSHAARGKKMLVTGHSLGGALSQLAASMFPFDQAYVFGCPRVGNQDFVSTISCPGVRFENSPDPVTMVPLRWGPVQAAWALAHFRKPTMYTQPWERRLLSGKGHRMESYLEGLGIT